MKRIFNLLSIVICCFFIQTLTSARANVVAFESIYNQKLDVGSIQTNYFDISTFFSSYTDLAITGGSVLFSFVDDADPLRAWASTSNYQLKRLETYNRNSNWQLYYERDVNHYLSDDEYEYYYAGILGDSIYGGNVQKNDYSMSTLYDYSVYNYNAWFDDKHYYTNTYEYYLGSYGDYSLSKNLNQISLDAIDTNGFIEYKVGVYGSDAIFKSALLTLEFTGQVITVAEPSSLSLIFIMLAGLLLNYRKNKSWALKGECIL